MCGICGIFGSPERGALERMMVSLESRGPDGSGVFLDGPIGLGIRRLSIIDIPGGSQPIFNEDGSLCIVFNGEIYNYRELRSFLSSRGHRFSTDSDTEVIIHAFEEFGVSCVRHLRGIFAFAIWDASKKRLFLARDRFGVKPLFFSRIKGSFVFASDVKSLFSSGLVGPAIDQDSLWEQAIFGCSIGDSTLFSGVKRLLPGHALELGASGECLQKYWSLEVFSDDSLSEPDAAARLRPMFDDAVRAELVSDVGFGVLLSGGLDSSLLAAQAGSLSSSPLHTFSISDDGSNEDLANARLVAGHLGADHHEFLVSPDDAISAFPSYILGTADIAPHFVYGVWMHLLSERVSKFQKVVLCAQGADELFAGYEHLADPLHFRMEHLEGRWAFFSPPSGFRQAGFFRQLVSDVSSRGLDAILSHELSNCLPNNQLALVDSASMQFGLEVRVPFLDAQFADLAMRIPSSLKRKDGVEKHILRRAFSGADLPPGILTRPKVPAGASTLPNFSAALERLANSLVPDARLRSHRHAHLLRSKVGVLSFDLLESLFIDNCASVPKGFGLSDLY